MSHTRSIIDCHLKPDLGHLDVVKLTTEDIDDYYGHLLRRGGRDRRPLARGTVTRIHGVLHRALAQAVRWEWIWSNPATNATPPRPEPAEIRPPSPRQVALLIESVRKLNPPLPCYLRLAASTAARRSQLLAFRWCNVDEEHRALSFSRALLQGPDGPTLTWTKTHRTYRVELDRDTYDVLREHRTSCETAAARAAGVELAGDAFVFSLRPDGATPWKPHWVTKHFIAARRAAELVYVEPATMSRLMPAG